MGRHRRRRGPARAVLVGASAALTAGAVAVGAGLVPGLGDGLTSGGGDGTAAGERPASAGAGPRAHSPAGDRSPSPEPSAERTTPEPEETPEETTSEPEPTPETSEPEPTPEPEPEPEPEPTQEPEVSAAEPPAPAPEPSVGPENSAAEQVLALVNVERAAASCPAVTLDAPLTQLATAFSRDMAERGFFSHTDPDGRDPWGRAAEAGIDYLGGENIARGQADAQAVMDAWMNSPGHRANILNCEFSTIGIGVHLGPGGPWWTQDFGF